MIQSTVREIAASPLTPREKEIVLWVAQGHPNKTIAEKLCLSEKTVRNHITHILKKLEFRRRTQLVCYAWQMNWIAKSEQVEKLRPQ